MEQVRPLLHIGYHRTGATLLQRRVFNDKSAGLSLAADPYNAHREVDGLFVRINPFEFDPEAARRRLDPAIESAQSRGLVPIISYERFSGSPFAGGYDSKEIADRLAATFPGARVLVMIREQASMLLSIYKLYLKQGGAMPPDEFFSGMTGAVRMPIFRFDFFEYHRLIGYYTELFGAENVLVLPYEILKADPAGFFERLGGFLGTLPAQPEQKGINVSPSALSLSVKRWLNRLLVKDSLNPAPVFPLRASNDLLKRRTNRIDRKLPVALKDRTERRWRALVEERTGGRYAESNVLTAKLAGLDLREFGYPCA